MGQAVTTLKFYTYGKKKFTMTGWSIASQAYKESIDLTEWNLAGRVFAVTGANSGLGREVTKFLGNRGARVYMICRSAERGEKERQALAAETGSQDLRLIQGDVSLKADVQRVCASLQEQEQKLDGLICNAGALASERKETSEGIEETLACHLVFGSYLLQHLLTPLLLKAEEPRVIFVSSGGMYNTKFPSWATAASTEGKFDGQLAYAYAKRGQVLLAEVLGQRSERIKYVSCHPGWTDTPGVSAAYGDKKKWLDPMRNMWQGSEGICWLTGVPSPRLEQGAYYLDRAPRRKHLPGVTRTENTPAEIENMMQHLRTVSGA